mgnify:CR=1 FL=1
MEKIVVELQAKTDKALKGIDKVAKSVEDLNKGVVSSNRGTSLGLRGVEESAKVATKGIKSLGVTLKAIGIGLLISSLATLKELFSRNQKAVDLFNTVFETAAIVVGEVVNAFTDIYDALTQSTDQFDALGKVMSGILTFVLAPFKMAFYGIQLGVQAAQLAWEESFFGDGDPTRIKELNANIQETKNSMKEVAVAAVDGVKAVVDNIGEAVSEVGKAGSTVIEELGKVSVTAAYDTAKANVELQKSAELAAARQGLIFETFDRQAEKLRQIRDDETKSIAERKKANDELLVKIADAEKGMLAQAQMQLRVANADLKRDKNNVESQVAQIEAVKELAAVRAQIEGIRSEQMSNENALNKESLELTNARLESESNLSIEQKRFNAEQIEDELLRLTKLKEIDELEKEQETLRLEAIVENANAGTQAKIDAEIALNEFTEQSRQTDLTRTKEIAKAKINLEKVQEEATKKRVQGTIGALGLLSSMLGESTAAGKGMAIAAATMNTYQGVTDALAAKTFTPFDTALKFVNAAGILSTGLETVKQITAVKIPNSSGGGSAPSSGGVSIPSAPPAFNVVGASETSQLADSIGSQSQEPTRAYVVSGDVTTSQEMDRNTIEGASI